MDQSFRVESAEPDTSSRLSAAQASWYTACRDVTLIRHAGTGTCSIYSKKFWTHRFVQSVSKPYLKKYQTCKKISNQSVKTVIIFADFNWYSFKFCRLLLETPYTNTAQHGCQSISRATSLQSLKFFLLILGHRYKQMWGTHHNKLIIIPVLPAVIHSTKIVSSFTYPYQPYIFSNSNKKR